MPYNTRRKSLSLPSLGIQLPNSTRTHRSNSKSSSPDQAQDTSPPSKRVKREHDSPQPLPSPRRSPSTDIKTTPSQSQKRAIAHTPPPSPGDITPYKKIDLEGIKDDVVISVIEQLERTGNRPHLIKELATVLLSTNNAIANSANPAALLMSRLTQYMTKRPWTALSPCPIAKELIPVHPRKIFFYLTSRPRGSLPDNSDDIIAPVIVDIKRLTPSITDPSINEDIEMDQIERSRFSPSPEVELFSPELEGQTPLPPTPGSQYSTHSSHAAVVHNARSRPSLRAPSPGLEADERGFTETATAVRANKIGHLSQLEITPPITIDEPKQSRTDHEVGVELFGRPHGGLSVVDHTKHMMSSPMIMPRHHLTIQIQDIDMDMDEAAWHVDIKSPEAVSFEEVEEMFDNF